MGSLASLGTNDDLSINDLVRSVYGLADEVKFLQKRFVMKLCRQGAVL